MLTEQENTIKDLFERYANEIFSQGLAFSFREMKEGKDLFSIVLQGDKTELNALFTFLKEDFLKEGKVVSAAMELKEESADAVRITVKRPILEFIAALKAVTPALEKREIITLAFKENLKRLLEKYIQDSFLAEDVNSPVLSKIIFLPNEKIDLTLSGSNEKDIKNWAEVLSADLKLPVSVAQDGLKNNIIISASAAVFASALIAVIRDLNLNAGDKQVDLFNGSAQTTLQGLLFHDGIDGVLSKLSLTA